MTTSQYSPSTRSALGGSPASALLVAPMVGCGADSIEGSSSYLVIIENNGTRFFRAWTDDSLDGAWTIGRRFLPYRPGRLTLVR